MNRSKHSKLQYVPCQEPPSGSMNRDISVSGEQPARANTIVPEARFPLQTVFRFPFLLQAVTSGYQKAWNGTGVKFRSLSQPLPETAREGSCGTSINPGSEAIESHDSYSIFGITSATSRTVDLNLALTLTLTTRQIVHDSCQSRASGPYATYASCQITALLARMWLSFCWNACKSAFAKEVERPKRTGVSTYS